MRLRLVFSVVMVAVFLVALIIWLYPSNRDFGPKNSSWNGLGGFVDDFEPLVIGSLSEISYLSGNTALVIIPYTDFDDFELELILKYVEGGGTLVLLDDYRYGNQMLSHMNVSPRFSNDPLLDPLFNFANSSLPVVTHFGEGMVSGGVQGIVLNHASSLDDVADNDIIAWSSRFSFLDENDNGKCDEGERKGPFPVACVMDYRSGRLVLVSDPSLLIMLDEDDNKQFFTDIVMVDDVVPALILDESHIPSSRLERMQDGLKSVRSALVTPYGVVALSFLILALVMEPVWRKNRDNLSVESGEDQGGNIDQ